MPWANSKGFNQQVRRLQREYYLGRMNRPTALAMMSELMHHHKFLGPDEELVDIPEDFGRLLSNAGFVGEFTVRQKNSEWAWKRTIVNHEPQRVVKFQTFESTPADDTRQFQWVGPEGNRKRVPVQPAPRVLSEEEQRFFALYEEQVTEEIVKGGRRRSAQIGDVEL
jgi:hypothetical protein